MGLIVDVMEVAACESAVGCACLGSYVCKQIHMQVPTAAQHLSHSALRASSFGRFVLLTF